VTNLLRKAFQFEYRRELGGRFFEIVVKELITMFLDREDRGFPSAHRQANCDRFGERQFSSITGAGVWDRKGVGTSFGGRIFTDKEIQKSS